MKTLAIILVWITLTAGASDWYVAQTVQGNGDGTTAGNAKALTFVTTGANWGIGGGLINPGDTVHVTGAITSTMTLAGSGATGNPVTILADSGASFVAANGTWGLNSTSAIFAQIRHDIIIDGGVNGVIQNTSNGSGLTFSNNSSGIYLNGGTNIEIRNWRIVNIYNRTNLAETVKNGLAIEVANFTGQIFTNISIHNCYISNAYYCIYFSYSGTGHGSCSAYSNTLLSASVMVNAGDGAAGSQLTGLFISNNVMNGCSAWEGSAGDAIHCDATHVFSVQGSGAYISNVVTANNVIGPAMGTNLTTYIYNENQVYGQLTFNNVLLCDAASTPSDGFIYHKSVNQPGQSNAMDFNNTIICAAPNQIGIYSGSSSSNMWQSNNIMVGVAVPFFSEAGSSLAGVDYNVEYGADHWISGGVSKTWAQWQALGVDGHSNTNNPFLSSTNSPYQPWPGIGSSAIASGVNISAVFNTDINGTPRGAVWDIGAYVGPVLNKIRVH